jgi:hypothetical protein
VKKINREFYFCPSPLLSLLKLENPAGEGTTRRQGGKTTPKTTGHWAPRGIARTEGRFTKCLSLGSSDTKLLEGFSFFFGPKNELGSCFKELLE